MMAAGKSEGHEDNFSFRGFCYASHFCWRAGARVVGEGWDQDQDFSEAFD